MTQEYGLGRWAVSKILLQKLSLEHTHRPLGRAFKAQVSVIQGVTMITAAAYSCCHRSCQFHQFASICRVTFLLSLTTCG